MSDHRINMCSEEGEAEMEPDKLVKWVKINILIPVPGSSSSESISTDAFGKVQFEGAERRATAKVKYFTFLKHCTLLFRKFELIVNLIGRILD